MLVNARSMRNKWLDITVELNAVKPDIICFTETWLTDDDTQCDTYNNYVSYFKCRKNMRGGGVAIFINPKFMSKEVFVECSCTSAYSCDSLSVIINPGKFQHLISVVYRSPSASVDDSRGLVNVVSDVRKRVRNCPWSIVGDFNLPNVTYGAAVRCTT